MEIKTFLENCQGRGIYLRAEKGELRYRSKKGAMTEEILTILKERKAEILNHLDHIADSNSRFKLISASQNRALLFHRDIWNDYSNRKMDVAAAALHSHFVIRHTGSIRTDTIIESIKILLERHNVLSSTIEMSGGNLYLVYRAKQSPAFQEILVNGASMERREKEGMRIANDLVWKEYNLDRDPLYRVFLIRLSENDYILGLVLHFAIGDPHSVRVLYQELSLLYLSIISNTQLPLPPARFQFMDYLSSMETWLASSTCARYLRYWEEHLKSTPITGLLPSNVLAKVCSIKGLGERKTIVLNAVVVSELKKIAAKLKTSLFMVLLAVHNVAIWRMTAQEELVITVHDNGRENPNLRYMIGHFVSKVPYKISLAENPNFIEIIERLKKDRIEAELHQPVPLDWVCGRLSKEGVIFSSPGMGFPAPSENPQNDLISLNQIRPLMFEYPWPSLLNCPFTHMIQFIQHSKGIDVEVSYHREIYQESTINSFMDHILETITAVIRDPAKKLKDLV